MAARTRGGQESRVTEFPNWLREFEHLLARCGFEVQALYGWFGKRPFGESSTEQVRVARKG